VQQQAWVCRAPAMQLPKCDQQTVQPGTIREACCLRVHVRHAAEEEQLAACQMRTHNNQHNKPQSSKPHHVNTIQPKTNKNSFGQAQQATRVAPGCMLPALCADLHAAGSRRQQSSTTTYQEQPKHRLHIQHAPYTAVCVQNNHS
jgi:hypothetical protein